MPCKKAVCFCNSVGYYSRKENLSILRKPHRECPPWTTALWYCCGPGKTVPATWTALHRLVAARSNQVSRGNLRISAMPKDPHPDQSGKTRSLNSEWMQPILRKRRQLFCTRPRCGSNVHLEHRQAHPLSTTLSWQKRTQRLASSCLWNILCIQTSTVSLSNGCERQQANKQHAPPNT